MQAAAAASSLGGSSTRTPSVNFASAIRRLDQSYSACCYRMAAIVLAACIVVPP